MAIWLPERRTLFLHIPKCAGFWVEEALKRSGETVRLLSNPNDPSRADRHATVYDVHNSEQFFIDEEAAPILYCAFVRHPIRWYESWWKYSNGRPHNWDEWRWHPTYPLQKCRHADFGEFIERVMQLGRPGFLTKLYRRYMEKTHSCCMVGRVETIVDDFAAMLRAIGVEPDVEVLRRIEPQNATGAGGTCGRPVWRPGQKELILESEREIVERWYGEGLGISD